MAILDQLMTPPMREVSDAEGRAIVDHAARRYLHVSGEDFIKAWDAGQFNDDADRMEVMRVAMLLPFAR